jgi:hypothetical protein
MIKDTLHDILADDKESFESVINDDDFWVIPEKSHWKQKSFERDFAYLFLYLKDLLLNLNKLISLNS